MKTRVRVAIRGVVQGVGFRPFVHHLARRFDATGWVLNASDGVTLEIETSAGQVEGFLHSLSTESPPLAVIEHIRVEQLPPAGYTEFSIRESVEKEGEFIPVSPDVATCTKCRTEIFSPTDPRFRYPFTNCTDCGPRFTIICDLPYDRAKTTMNAFPMCHRCAAEYHDIANRRYHAQPNACPVCGPQVWLESTSGERQPFLSDALAEGARLLKAGRILAIKGLGGFHLACDAENESAVLELRRRKGREEKPFALMTANVEMVARFCEVNEEEAALLRSPAAPIVLLKKKTDTCIAEAVAPRNKYLGVMLPYTPLHHLLLNEPGILALVMTSGNLSEEPLCRTNDEARHRLGPFVDYFLFHNRDIAHRCDDSVVRLFPPASGGNHFWPSLQFLRRSRGYAPFPVRVDRPLQQLLAVGAELKNTFCFTRDSYLFLSHHIGDLQNVETLEYFRESLEHYRQIFRIVPEAVAHDLHPDYLSTKYAMEQIELPQVGVQHHHAHIASCLAEHNVDRPVIGVAFDGIGYGSDGTIWGGEFLIADAEGFERKAHLRCVPMPGGDRATREPWRMAVAYLCGVFGDEWTRLRLPVVNDKTLAAWPTLKHILHQNINCPETSSCGRLFDAVAAILGVREEITFEGQAAMELEMAADETVLHQYDFAITSEAQGQFVVDASKTIAGVAQDMQFGVPVSVISGKFHRTIAAIVGDMCQRLRSDTNTNVVAISGGVFQNRLLLRLVLEELSRGNFNVLYHHRIPCNDGGIAVGQAWVANAVLRKQGQG